MVLWSLLIALGGCDAPGTLDPIADARGEQIAQQAASPIRIAGALGGMTAYICGLEVADWAALDDDVLTLPDGISDKLGVNNPGAVEYDSATGGAEVSWTAVELESGIPVEMTLEVLRATSSFKVSFEIDDVEGGDVDEDTGDLATETADTGEEDDEEIAFEGSATLSVGTCGDAEASVELEMAIDRGEENEVVLAPGGEGAITWTRGSIWPDAGAIQWSLGAASPSVSLPATAEVFLSADAEEIADRQWPGTASNEGWERTTRVSLMR